MEYADKNLVFSISHDNSYAYTATVTIKLPLIDAMYRQVLEGLQQTLTTCGFISGLAPISYIESTYKNYIIEHLKEFFFNHYIVNFLCQQIRINKIVLVGEPQLKKIDLEPNQEAQFSFSLTQIVPELTSEWKRYHFKAPTRKKYKDLDRQVETFIKTEEEKSKIYNPKLGIQILDWVAFTISITNEIDYCNLATHNNHVWIKIGKEDADREAHALFLGKNIDDTFITQSNFLQKYFSKKIDTNYIFKVTIIQHIPYSFFSIPNFKNHFKIKTIKEMHHKFIEVFSHRNDISQRREIIETTFKTLLKHYRINLPENLIQQQEQIVLNNTRKNPDYHVYKAQKNFSKIIRLLAEKQLQEAVLIDHLSYQENIALNPLDVASYFNFLQRPRTKEFICFDLPATQMNGQEQPLPAEIVNQSCLREKTLNYIINYLTV